MPCEAVSVADRERVLLAGYALHSADSAGRKHAEPTHLYRGPFQRDRDRIVHSTAYRRLSGKTQVFTSELGDFHRTRLTHTHEVASVSRTLGRALRLNEDLIEALALMHDIGHPPFGHAGEDVLDECLRDVGGFSHNRQALRIVELLESRYPEFPGLNLSLEVLAGQQSRADKSRKPERPLLEVQIVDAADSVAYDTHDVDDALQLGLLTLADLEEIPLWRECGERIRARYASLQTGEYRRAVLHELIDRQIGDLIVCASRRIDEWGVATTADVRRVEMIIRPNEELFQQKAVLVSAGLSPSASRHRPDDRPGPTPRDVPGLQRQAGVDAAKLSGPGRHDRPAAFGRRLHRRNDRPLRPARVPTAVRPVADFCR